MKRKVIQIAESTQLISLPRQWAKQYNIKKGMELEVDIKGNKLEVSTEKNAELDHVDLDITDLDRTSIMFYVRSAYRKGYDTINVRFATPTTKHLRTGEIKTVISVLHEEINRLVGIEIVQQRENFCVIKDISTLNFDEFDTVMRRIFLLLTDMAKDFLEGAKTGNTSLLETLEEKHNSITKFISYCLRLINKKGFPDQQKNCLLYHILASLDKVTDVLKYVARDVVVYKKKINNETLDIFNDIIKSVIIYYELFYNFDTKIVSKLYANRDYVIGRISGLVNAQPEELLFINALESILETYVDITETRMSLELK